MLRTPCRAFALPAVLPSLAIAALMAWTACARAAGDGFSGVTFTASGSPGAWILDFTVVPTNPANMAHLSFIDPFEVGPEAGSDYVHRAGYTATSSSGTTAWHGTSAVSPTFQESYPGGLSGFETLALSYAVPENVNWSVLVNSGSSLNDFYLHGGYQATVFDSGVAHISGVVPGVPESGTAQLLLIGLAALGFGAKVLQRAATTV